MSFLKKFLKRRKYSDVLGIDNCECSQCQSIPVCKLKKCENCFKRRICRDCYKYENIKLCKECDTEYEKWQNSLFKVKAETEKENKYKINKNEFNNEFLNYKEGEPSMESDDEISNMIMEYKTFADKYANL